MLTELDLSIVLQGTPLITCISHHSLTTTTIDLTHCTKGNMLLREGTQGPSLLSTHATAALHIPVDSDKHVYDLIGDGCTQLVASLNEFIVFTRTGDNTSLMHKYTHKKYLTRDLGHAPAWFS